MGTLAEWLRRGPAKAVCNACESSNLSGVDNDFCLQYVIVALSIWN
jgi:hypothetical protein